MAPADSIGARKPTCSCCGGAEEAPAAPPCPGCGQAGRPVQALTLKALLAPPLGEALGAGPWSFCATPACAVVYFDEAGHAFRKDQLRVRVGLKETEAPRPLCYCFGLSEEGLRAEWAATGRLDSVAALRLAVKEGRCRCEVENPSGACCLGEVLKATRAFGAS